MFTAVLPDANQLVSQLAPLEGKEIVVVGRITNSFGIPQIRLKSANNIFVIGPNNQAVPLRFQSGTANPKQRCCRQGRHDFLAVRFRGRPDETNTFVTLSGKTYQNAKVIQVEPDGITIKYAPNGFGLREIKLTFNDLPVDIQQMYGFDPQIAAAYITEQRLAADLSDAEKRRREWRARHDELASRAGEVQQLYEQKKRAYEDEKNDYDAKLRLGAWRNTSFSRTGRTARRRADLDANALCAWLSEDIGLSRLGDGCPCESAFPSEGARIVSSNLRRLKSANDDHDREVWLISKSRQLDNVIGLYSHQVKHILTTPWREELLLLVEAIEYVETASKENSEKIRDLVAQWGEEGINPPPFVTGDHLRAIGYVPGKQFKIMLETIRDAEARWTAPISRGSPRLDETSLADLTRRHKGKSTDQRSVFDRVVRFRAFDDVLCRGRSVKSEDAIEMIVFVLHDPSGKSNERK